MKRLMLMAAISFILAISLSFINAIQYVEVPSSFSYYVEGEKTHLYDFSTNAGIDRMAYRYEVSSKPPSYKNEPSILFNTLEYSNISSYDDTYQIDAASNGYYASHRFVFNIHENVSNISKLKIFWRGAGLYILVFGQNYYPISSGSGITLYAWNYSSFSYDEINSTSTYNVMNISAYISPQYYISSTGELTILAVENSASSFIFLFALYSIIATDYVSAEVTYTGG